MNAHHNYEHVIDEENWQHWCCTDCGAHADSVPQIKHHDTCQPGESERWAKFYEEANDEELTATD